MNTITSTNSIGMLPSITSQISTDIISQNDSDSNESLSIEELDISEDLFSSLDNDSDGLVTQNEIASAIDSELSSYDQMPNPEEFATLLSNLGLEMPELPEKPQNNQLATELMSTYDTDGDSLLSSDEVSILNEEEFSALDSDGDGSITTDELSAAIDEVTNGNASSTEVSAASEDSKTSSGTPPPGGSASSSEEEDYDELDTNEDGIVSFEEKMAGLGIDVNETSDSSDIASNPQESIKMLFEAIKYNSSDNENGLDLSSFGNIMKMVNNENNNQEINTYVNNLSNSTSSLFGYA
ncbi:hypothetical protein [Halarcobacter sp.]|uniref:hypothetical protein n=1 Tax=Halarcobacter sp. TaxID=2321133 RepID=UPI0029F4E237|nr:hypothetical protein [Halarcobacter sp.]